MPKNEFTILKAAVRVASVLLAGAVMALGQQTVNLTAGPTSITLPDGSTVPMWGYTCGALATGSTATCAALNPTAGATSWSPVVITVPTGQYLTINLTNNLSFTAGAGTNTVPTSLTIVGQLGGGLGSLGQRVTVGSPTHNPLSVTWPTANTGPTFVPPPQADRVQSFATEVAAGAMKPLTFGSAANPLRPGTYLLESGTHPSIQGPMGLYGILVVTTVPVGTTPGTAYPAGANPTLSPAVTYNAEVPLLLSEIDPVQNNAVNAAVTTAGFTETAVWSGQPNQCGNPTSSNYHTCYPPAVNYTPLYYLFNGVAFNKTSATTSLFSAAPATGVTGKVLVRFVNAGLRMHVPSIVGSLTNQAATGTPVVTGGFSLIAEDGFPQPGIPRVQNEVFMAAGKTYDVMINVPAAGGTALPVYDRELSLSGNGLSRDAGMLAYVSVNGAGLPAAGALGAATATPDLYNSLVAGQTFTVKDVAKGVIANDVRVYGVSLSTPATNGTVTLNANGTFTYVPSAALTSDSFGYCANGTTLTSAIPICTTVTLGPAAIESATGVTAGNASYTSKLATFLKIANPGPLVLAHDAAGYPLTMTNVAAVTAGLTVVPSPAGGFTASVGSSGTYSFTYKAQNSQGTLSNTATVQLIFPVGSGLNVSVVDGATKAAIAGQDYRWIIEEDRTFYIDPTKTTNTGSSGPITPILGVNFHTSDMTYVAQGCTGPLSCENGQMVFDPASGNHLAAVCDVGDGVCRTTAAQQTPVLPGQVALDPTKRYYISVLPGDAANPFIAGAGAACAPYSGTASSGCGHSMGGAPIAVGQTSVTVAVEQDPFPPGKLSVNVFEDDFPLNGEQDGGGGVDVLSPNEPGLGGFNVILWDDMGGSGDVTGQMTYDMFNQPLGNSLDGTTDPATGLNACPITNAGAGITGMIVTCPKYESDGVTLSPLAGQAVVSNLMPGRFSVQAVPGADRIARGEEWLQTNTLDGQKPHDSFIRIGEPAYFQEFGPAGYHVSIGFANPKIITGRLPGICNGTDPNLQAAPCNNSVSGRVTGERMSRTPDERLYSSGSRDTFYFTQCYVSVGDPDGEDFAFTKCNADGTFSFSGLPAGDWRITTFDQWNDQLVDGLSTPVGLGAGATLCPGAGSTVTNCNMGDIAASQWQSNIYTRTFIDDSKDGVFQTGEAGIPLINTAVRYRDGSVANNLVTDFDGIANFNETFPLFNWYVVETDTTRYKNTGIHVVYDAGGPADGSPSCGVAGYPACGTSTIGKFLARTYEDNPLPSNLSVPGAVYCSNADCTGSTIASGAVPSSTTKHSTGRIDAPWVGSEGWQGFSGQNNFLEFGKTPYVPGENGGIHGHVVYASTRPFDDPYMLVQTQWEPLVPHVTMNLYQEGTAGDGVTPTLTLVDTTQTSSWDDWAQGFRSDSIPNMNCPGQSTADLFYFSLYQQPFYLNAYNAAHGGPAAPALPYNSQYKCYDGMHNWNQLEPAPYDGVYAFPSVTGRNPSTGNTTGTNCTICSKDPDAADPFRFGKEDMLPAGKYVVEVVLPPGYELVKEEDKNILIGDNFIAPVSQQFGGLGNIFIMPDQASVASQYNANSAQNATQGLGTAPLNGIVPGFTPEPLWPCVGATRIVPDYISLFPASHQVSPFAGATRNLCDRKEVTLGDQMGAIAKFYVYTSTHKAGKFTGVITDDFTSEFDPFSPQFGEKFAPANQPISVKDWTGAEISRVYSDWWGDYDGLTFSTWEVNPPNPTGYSPTMMVMCMNDKGPIPGPGGTMITDPLYNPDYSQFCYELPFMPGQTAYLDTPVVPTSAFSAGYNHPDCAYPALTPAIAEVDGDGIGPWVAAAGASHPLTITALGDQTVFNYGYSGPQATSAPFNNKTVTRHYGFGAAAGKVTIGGVTANISSWSDSSITVTVPTTAPLVPNCAIQQQAQYAPTGATTAQCGELVITTASGQQSIDTVTVTIGGGAPTHIPATSPIQAAIDAAKPGDLLILDPTCSATGAQVACTTAGATHSSATHSEMVLMWKPVRLQGVGAASSVIDANTQPAGKLDPWRRQVDCLFGLAMNGTPITGTNVYDQTGTFSCTSAMQFSVDRLPLEATVGWDATLNGNLAELLQEPTLMGAYEGAGITVLAKGVKFPTGSNPFASDTFPTGTVLLTPADCATGAGGSNPYPSNFYCNPARIDGLGVTDSSQGGGGIFVHAYGHGLEIANDRVFGNIGTLSGGINVGQGEFPPGYFLGGAANSAPGSCMDRVPGPGISIVNPRLVTNQEQPYCFNVGVNMHHNSVTSNSSIGDELFSATPAGAGGVSFCTGADYYKFNYNWVCGNMGTGDGGGFGHLGLIFNGDIEHNTVLFNQSVNPTISTNGGGVLVMGTPDVDPLCGALSDLDCSPPGMSDGTGPGLVINANLIMGNGAESGSGGGLRLQDINGTEVTSFPSTPAQWYQVTVTNNIIANNVAGWDGAGVSMQDALDVNFINNTVMSNDSTASAGVLFNTLGAPLAGSPNAGNTNTGTNSNPQPAGLVVMPNSSPLVAALTSLPSGQRVVCPAGHYNSTSAVNGTCTKVSYPELYNDVFWQNRSFQIGVGALSAAFQQNVISLYNASFAPGSHGTAVASQTATGACVAGSSYWDIGVRGDSGPANHGSGYTLSPTYSMLTSIAGYNATALHNAASNPAVVSQYCNGSRVPPEFAAGTFNVPPGISDATVPNPIFNLTAAATVDEGNNWVNMTWGPLALTNPVTGVRLGNYSLASGSPAINYIPVGSVGGNAAPFTDYFGNVRPAGAGFDVGAVEFGALPATPSATLTPTSWTVSQTRNCPGTTLLQRLACALDPSRAFTLQNTGGVPLTGITQGVLGGANPGEYAIVPLLSTCGPAGGGQVVTNTTLAPNATCVITVQFKPQTALTIGLKPATVSVTDSVGTQTSTLSGTAN